MKIFVYTSSGKAVTIIKKACPEADVTASCDERILHYENPDVGISFLNNNKIRKMDLDKCDWFNFHPGPLPDYGGRNLCYHAIMNDSKYFGASIHKVTENYDDGPIVAVERFDIEPWMTAGDLVDISRDLMYIMLKKWIRTLVFAWDNIAYKDNPVVYYKQTKIDDTVDVGDEAERKIRALTTKKHSAYINIGGVKYKVKKC